MSEDWFEVICLMNGRVFLQGSRADQSAVVVELSQEAIDRIEALQAKHEGQMQRLLRELAA
jgi:hypothetical protein